MGEAAEVVSLSASGRLTGYGIPPSVVASSSTGHVKSVPSTALELGDTLPDERYAIRWNRWNTCSGFGIAKSRCESALKTLQ